MGKGGKGEMGGKGGKGGKGSKDNGMCLTDEEQMMICHHGSELGDKANAAWPVCQDKFASMMEMRALDVDTSLLDRAKSKGKGKKPSKPKAPKCPEVDDIMMMVGEYYAGPLCMFKEMGWLDEECNSDDALIEADIITLPTEISASLMGEEYDQCVNMTMMYAGKMLKAELKKETKGKCSCEDYSEEDQMA